VVDSLLTSVNYVYLMNLTASCQLAESSDGVPLARGGVNIEHVFKNKVLLTTVESSPLARQLLAICITVGVFSRSLRGRLVSEFTLNGYIGWYSRFRLLLVGLSLIPRRCDCTWTERDVS